MPGGKGTLKHQTPWGRGGAGVLELGGTSWQQTHARRSCDCECCGHTSQTQHALPRHTALNATPRTCPPATTDLNHTSPPYDDAPLPPQDLDRAGQALHVIFPSDQPGDDDENPATHDQYVRTHGAFLPGEQRRRNYDWQRTGVDPDSHRFGAVDKAGVVEGVRKALQPELDETLPHAPRVVARALDEHKAVATDELGRTKQLGGGDRPHLPPDHAYGLPLRRGPNEPTVDDLLRGGYPADEQQPDADLGKSIRPGFRNIAPEGRTFGVPSVRTDLPLPQGARSVANATNYGNEPDVMQLICPPKSAQRGIGNDMYVVPRAKGELKALVAAAGISVSDSEFETLFDASAAADGRTAEHASLGTFMKLRHQALAASMGL